VVGLYVTETDSQGRWKSPLWVEQGLDYVIVYEKPSAFGPDVIRVTV
jgi:hypothetical protein